ncbi:NADH-quinone oxidoreductase chain E [Ameyamaea chiangmaiensis NBRC 103196]|uniref:NAD(P)H-dependent oxidoreductase subunit E n=1 Tax=Ameyamaea chiangmaiensis TaxID=442969 RepID=A0A850PC34_9PROT|nr:NAD(P)H-dependent oxidoreductase subunit E [Ameyamaea chiangmaiensis]MBS4074541.1 NAD(P)H-dependent oxidoreductase subunit E [Ameyamaea chiangmaiensis]NVN39502.1 NAD(P)H-dependent oxidoreductase subunit E [Ameyamaea chiangmaiensis]GBQ72417.1 NADH-quinone oxidoreductase chain E [Ameyamaea chiangmaiensis NBRC 103196]
MSSRSPAEEALQPAEFAFDAESEAQIETIVAKYPPARKASAVIPLLYVAQNQMGRLSGSAWLPRVAMDQIAARLEMAPIRVYEVASFYFMFNVRPIGRYHLQACTTTSCWLRGSDDVVAACKTATGIRHMGGTSDDGLFTLTEVECLGACANAPILQIDDEYYEDLDGPRTVELIEALRRGERPAPGPSIDRMGSAPSGGRKVLLDDDVPVSVPGEGV